ncbi:MAG: nucleotidyltransferase domain-containing protein [Planctomycetota bacterium]
MFGKIYSFKRGDERPDSDYDFLIVAQRPHKEFRKKSTVQ